MRGELGARRPGWAYPCVACIVVLATLFLVACEAGGKGASGGRITVGAVSFAENQIVAEMYARVLEAEGYDVNRRFNFPSREELHPALRSGEVDIAPEYLATLLSFLDPDSRPSSDPEENVAQLEEPLDAEGLRLLDHSRANDTNAFVVTPTTAKAYDLDSVSDLKPVSRRLTFGGPPECPRRPFCLKGLRDVYGIRFGDFKALDPGGPLTIAALDSGQVDVALLFSTSGVIASREWVLLEDDRGLQAADNITPVVRAEIFERKLADALNALSRRLTTQAVTELNARVEVSNEDFRTVARDWLEKSG